MKVFNFILLFSVLLIFGSCEKEPIANDSEIESLKRGSKIPNNTICIYEAEHGNQASKRHRVLGFIPVGSDGCYTIFISGGCNNFYTQATIDGIEEYNSLTGTSLRFDIVNSQDDADIIVLCQNLGGGDCNGGVANLNSITNQLEVRLHTDISTTDCFCNDGAAITSCDIQFIAMHEIGHAIGFAHTNSFFPLIPGTPLNDFFSIMNSGGLPNALCAGLCSFSPEDINAIQILYPPNPSCGGFFSGNSSTPGYQTYPAIPLTIPCTFEGELNSFNVQANDVPNRFRIVEVGVLPGK